MPEIQFSPVALMIAHSVGTFRHVRARAAGIVDAQVGGQRALQIDIDGVMGEWAFARLANLCPDLDGMTAAKADLWTRDGRSVDVKTTRHQSGRLLATLKKEQSPCDIYVLMIVGDGGLVRFAGWATAGELFNEANKIDLGHGVGYALTQAELHTEFLAAQKRKAA